MLKALIIEDEELARKRLAKQLEIHRDKIEIMALAKDGIEAVKMIDELKADLIFLDIQMPGLTGFEVLANIKENPLVIFTTAYDEYALKAFENNAIGYLLKPIESEPLEKVINKLSHPSLSSNQMAKDLSGLLEKLGLTNGNPTTKETYLKRIQVKLGDRILLIDLNDIMYFESQDKYTNVHTLDHLYIIDNSLIELESKLNPEQFMRIHRSTLVNVSWIGEIQRYIGGKLQVQLKDAKKTLLVVSRSYTDQVRSL